jgi:Transcriptional regulator
MKDTREHILNTAFMLFLHKSYKEVTLKEIVEKSGLSKGAFYHYFSSKEQIFLEIVNNAFVTLVDVDFSRFSKNSLREFYHDYLNYYKEMNDSLLAASNGGYSFDLNYYSIIFDAMRLFAEFRDKMVESNQKEMEFWKAIIRMAKEKGEIRSSMSDEDIANIFIYTNGGIGMNNILFGKVENLAGELQLLWDSFYSQIKK